MSKNSEAEAMHYYVITEETDQSPLNENLYKFLLLKDAKKMNNEIEPKGIGIIWKVTLTATIVQV